MTCKTAIYTTTDDVPASERAVGFFWWPPHGKSPSERANVCFRGTDKAAVQLKIETFYNEQMAKDAANATKIDARTKEGKALLAAQKLAA